MVSKRNAAHESVWVYRAKMKQQGFRQISIWIPDTKSPKFRKECRRRRNSGSNGIDILERGGIGDAESPDVERGRRQG
jgi:hypothetical protein